MNGFKTCSKDHYYDENLDSCPYCPSGNKPISGNAPATEVSGEGNDLGKTRVSEGIDAPPTHAKGNQSSGRDLSKTTIQFVEEEADSKGNLKEVVSSRTLRKVVGWIISYSLDPMGVDYRIFEGNNSLGREASNTISIPGDSSISARHASLLYKKGKFFVRDEMAANGTFINGVELEIGQPSRLNDGDTLTIGNTKFTFKTPL